MSKLYLVRHGQASFMSDDYDRLSPIGHRQGVCLGDYWGKRGLTFDTAFIGPLRRHRQTFDAFIEGYAPHGLQLPEPIVDADFIEHEGFQMSRAVTPGLVGKDPYITEHYNADGMDRRTHLAVFRHVMLRWAAGEIEADGYDSWQTFRANVSRGLQTAMAATGRGEQAIVFTSGGTIAAAMGHALEMGDVASIKLNWIVRNTAYAEFHFRDSELSLSEFNAIPHIEDEDLHTYV